MRQVVRKLYWGFEKEERWLNEMAAKGLALVDHSWGRYSFEESEPGEYICRIEMLDYWPSNFNSVQYIRFLEDSGVEHVATYGTWVFFRRKSAEGPFDIYSDAQSRIRHYKRVAIWWFAMAALEYFVGIFNLSVGIQLWRQDFPPAVNFVCAGVLLTLGTFLLSLGIRYWRKATRIRREKMLVDQ